MTILHQLVPYPRTRIRLASMPSPSSRIPATFHFEKHHINAERLDLDCTQAWEVYLSTADDWFQFVFDRAMLREPRGRHRRESAFEITPMPVDKPVLYKMPKHIVSDTLKIYIVREFATLKDRDEVPGLLRQFSKLCRYNATPIDEVRKYPKNLYRCTFTRTCLISHSSSLSRRCSCSGLSTKGRERKSYQQ